MFSGGIERCKLHEMGFPSVNESFKEGHYTIMMFYKIFPK